jgi:hypothetical protein
MSTLSSRTRSGPAGFIEPCLPSPADKPPSGANWVHEIKHDGYGETPWASGLLIAILATSRCVLIKCTLSRLRVQLLVQRLAGIVSKRLGSRYRSGRSPDWLKFKNPDAPAVKREAEEDWGR